MHAKRHLAPAPVQIRGAKPEYRTVPFARTRTSSPASGSPMSLQCGQVHAAPDPCAPRRVRSASTCNTAPNSSAKQAAIGSATGPQIDLAIRNGPQRPFPAPDAALRRRSGHGRRAADVDPSAHATPRTTRSSSPGLSRSAGSPPLFVVHLRPAAAAQPIFSRAQINQQQAREAATNPVPASAFNAHLNRRECRRRSATRARSPHDRRVASLQAVLMDKESLPTGMVIPSAAQSSTPTARTVAYKSASSPGWPQAAIQFADKRMSVRLRDIGRQNIGDRLAHGQSARCRRIEHGHRRAFSHGHGLAAIIVIAVQRYRHIGNRNLPRPHHLVAADQPAHGAIADGDQEGLVGNRGQTQQSFEGIGDGRALGRKTGDNLGSRLRTSRIMRGGLPSSTSMRHVHRRAMQQRIVDQQPPSPVISPTTAKGQRSRSHSAANARRSREAARARSAPAPRCTRSPSATVPTRRWESCADRFGRRDGCARSPRARRWTVRRRPRRGSTKWDSYRPRPATVDDLLGAALNFRVAALHRCEIQISGTLAAADRRGRAAAQTDQHGGSAEHDQRRTHDHVFFLDILPPAMAQVRRRS